MTVQYPGSNAARRATAAALAVAAVLIVTLLFTAPAHAQNRRAATNGRVQDSMGRAINWLYNQQKPDGSFDTPYVGQHPGGTESLFVLANLAYGQNLRSPQFRAALAYIEGLNPQTVYTRSIRAMVYARLANQGYGKRLDEDVKWIISQQTASGGWGYGKGHDMVKFSPDWTDLSNAQMALLALRDAADAGASIPPVVWRKARAYLLACQNPDGGWGYTGSGESAGQVRTASYGTMTACGAASALLLSGKIAAIDQSAAGAGALAADVTPTTTRPANSPGDMEQIDKACKWLADRMSLEAVPKKPPELGDQWLGYYLFALIRVQESLGRRELGDQGKWYQAIATELINRQDRTGPWLDAQIVDPQERLRQAIVPTCFAVMCLARCYQPVLINKLAMDSSDQFDIDNLARRMSLSLDLPGAWQSVSAADLPSVIRDAPILFISGSGKGSFGPAMDEPIRRFIQGGGSVVVQPFSRDALFFQAAQDYFVKLFPSYKSVRLDSEHPVYTLRYKMPPGKRPGLIGIGDYARTRIFILENDLGGEWYAERFADAPEGMRLMGNIILYTTDQQWLDGRLRPPPAEAKTAMPLKRIEVARVKHNGDWDACPLALQRLGEALTQGLSIGIDEQPPVDLGTPAPAGIKLLWLTGSVSPELDAVQRANLLKFLDAGGTLFVDPAVGNPKFTADVTALLQAVFGEKNLRRLPAAHGLMTGDFAGGIGNDLTKPDPNRQQFTQALMKELQDNRQPMLPIVMGVDRNDRLAVIFSQYGVSCPLEGVPIYGCRGLATLDARRLACNVVLYAISQK